MELKYTQENAQQEIQTSLDASEGPNPAPLSLVRCGDLKPAGCGCVVLHMDWIRAAGPFQLNCSVSPAPSRSINACVGI